MELWKAKCIGLGAHIRRMIIKKQAGSKMDPFAIYWTCLFFVGVILLLHRCFVIIDLQCEKKTLFGKIQAKGEQSIGCYML